MREKFSLNHFDVLINVLFSIILLSLLRQHAAKVSDLTGSGLCEDIVTCLDTFDVAVATAKSVSINSLEFEFHGMCRLALMMSMSISICSDCACQIEQFNLH